MYAAVHDEQVMATRKRRLKFPNWVLWNPRWRKLAEFAFASKPQEDRSPM